jgi:DhnA family fructose-bisphosphate aldolase class Ia
MDAGKAVRMGKLWKHERAVLIPYDHASYSGPIPGIEDLRRLTSRIARTAVDGILMMPGTLPLIAEEVGALGVMVRLDGGFTKYATSVTDYQEMISVQDAVRLGADAGIIFTMVGIPQEAISLQRLGNTAADARLWGLPLASEVLPPSLLNNHFGVDMFPKHRKASDTAQDTTNVTRIAVEHGADIVKTRYGGDVDQFRLTVTSCGGKVLVAGGPKVANGDEGLLRLAADCVQAGAHGIIFGRNVWQHPRMEKMIAALCAIVHEEETVPRAMKLMR